MHLLFLSSSFIIDCGNSLVTSLTSDCHLFLLCRYDKLNERALRDVELYDKTGRVRSPSPAQLTDSEEDSQAEVDGEEEHSLERKDAELTNRHAVGGVGEEEIDARRTLDLEQSKKLGTSSNEQEDSDSDFDPSEQEADNSSTSEDTSFEKENAEEEYSEDTSKNTCILSSPPHAEDPNTLGICASKNDGGIQSQVAIIVAAWSIC